jgi:hypothetical protein
VKTPLQKALVNLNVGTYPSQATNPNAIQPGWMLKLQ